MVCADGVHLPCYNVAFDAHNISHAYTWCSPWPERPQRRREFPAESMRSQFAWRRCCSPALPALSAPSLTTLARGKWRVFRADICMLSTFFCNGKSKTAAPVRTTSQSTNRQMGIKETSLVCIYGQTTGRQTCVGTGTGERSEAASNATRATRGVKLK